MSVAKILGQSLGTILNWPVNEFYATVYGLETLAVIEQAAIDEAVRRKK